MCWSTQLSWSAHDNNNNNNNNNNGLNVYSTFLDTQRPFTWGWGPHLPPPMCCTHLGDAPQPIGARTLTTHQLEVKSEGINESANYTGGWLGGPIEWAWLGSFSPRSPGNPLLIVISAGTFRDLLWTKWVRSSALRLLRMTWAPTRLVACDGSHARKKPLYPTLSCWYLLVKQRPL